MHQHHVHAEVRASERDASILPAASERARFIRQQQTSARERSRGTVSTQRSIAKILSGDAACKRSNPPRQDFKCCIGAHKPSKPLQTTALLQVACNQTLFIVAHAHGYLSACAEHTIRTVTSSPKKLVETLMQPTPGDT